ncbi:MAG TPA: SRPBCC family protein [Gemmatimonadaceae bacterium]|nr:SRPBCC family protein [Gemmatimonadaceae bacterium]
MGTQQQVARPARRALSSNGRFREPVRGAPRHSTDVFASDRTPVTNFLGWFSIGLGLAEILAPAAVARLIGVDEEDHKRLLRAYGAREIAAGVGILTRPKPTYWMWNRVIGDAVDLASLGRAMRSSTNDHTRLRMATAAVIGVTALDLVDSVRLTSEKAAATGHDEGSFTIPNENVDGTRMLSAAIRVNRPVEEVFEFWKNPSNYPLFMSQMESVRVTGTGRSHWKVKAPAGFSVEWDAELMTELANEMISWRATDDARMENVSTVRFEEAPRGRGTIVRIEVEFKPKAGPLGNKLAHLFRSIPKTQMANDLRRFKQVIEVGEILKSDATAVPALMQAAQPPEEKALEEEP